MLGAIHHGKMESIGGGCAMRGQVAVPPCRSVLRSRSGLRLIGFSTAALGLAMIVGTLGVVNVFSVTPCDNNGLPNPCFFTPAEDEGEGIGPLRNAEPI